MSHGNRRKRANERCAPAATKRWARRTPEGKGERALRARRKASRADHRSRSGFSKTLVKLDQQACRKQACRQQACRKLSITLATLALARHDGKINPSSLSVTARGVRGIADA